MSQVVNRMKWLWWCVTGFKLDKIAMWLVIAVEIFWRTFTSATIITRNVDIQIFYRCDGIWWMSRVCNEFLGKLCMPFLLVDCSGCDGTLSVLWTHSCIFEQQTVHCDTVILKYVAFAYPSRRRDMQRNESHEQLPKPSCLNSYEWICTQIDPESTFLFWFPFWFYSDLIDFSTN